MFDLTNNCLGVGELQCTAMQSEAPPQWRVSQVQQLHPTAAQHLARLHHLPQGQGGRDIRGRRGRGKLRGSPRNGN